MTGKTTKFSIRLLEKEIDFFPGPGLYYKYVERWGKNVE